METTQKHPSQHIGRKIARIRELRGIKQEALANELNITQQAVSKMEQSEKVDEETLERVAKALDMSKEAIEAFNEDAIMNIISNTFNDQSYAVGVMGPNFHCTFNPIDKIVELYERLVKSEREKVEMMNKGK